jgi:hypothetical protein
VIAAAALGACSDATPKPTAPAPIVVSASIAAPASRGLSWTLTSS